LWGGNSARGPVFQRVQPAEAGTPENRLSTNLCLLEAQRITHACILAEETFQQLHRPRMADGQ
jgi:hypothetical protein